MSEDLVNQLTLNYLISKHQLSKLNKKIKENNDNSKITDKEKYSKRIKQLFDDLLDNNAPNNLMIDVKTGFEFFIDKCIYFLKIQDDNEAYLNGMLHTGVVANTVVSKKYDNDNEDNNNNEDSNDDDNNDDDNNEDNNEDSNDEDSNNEDSNDEDSNNEDSNDEDNNNEDSNNVEPNVLNDIKNKHALNEKTNIQKLPIDWFQSVRQNYKHNHIISRKKDVIIGSSATTVFRDEKKKI